MIMVGGKRWSVEQKQQLFDLVNELTGGGMTISEAVLIVFQDNIFPGRSRGSVEAMYYDVAKNGVNKVNDTSKGDISNAINDFKDFAKRYVELEKENAVLKKKLAQLQQMKEDFDALNDIMKRARSLVASDSLGERPAASQYKMDANGNLERVVK